MAGCPLDDVPRADAAGVPSVRPELVGEVEHTDRTGLDRPGPDPPPLPAGWRPDSGPEDVTVEEPPAG